MIDNFDDIILDYEISLLRLSDTELVCSYNHHLLEIQAERLFIKSMSMERLHLQVDKLQCFKLTRKDNG
ncbi:MULTISPECIES: hypothetical protein [unclassified Psychrobacillus]|uniref:hypothetical protein n=1 Tax=unclassified Psychrobacillus TaxID=2636677 RepID=UPI00119F5120